MKNIILICQKELKSYFASPIAYVVMAIFGVVFGAWFYAYTRYFVQQSGFAQMQGMPGSVNDAVIRPMLGFAGTVGLFLIPMVTMRLFAEETRSGTMELLLTSPVRDIEILMGKWVGALLLYLCMLGISMLDFAMLFAWGRPDLKPLLIGFLGLLLQGGCLLAIGAFVSSLTRNQIVAAAIAFAISILLFILSSATAFNTSVFAQVVAYFSIITHFERFSMGVLDSKDVVFYLSMMFLFLFLTSRSLESLRWRA